MIVNGIRSLEHASNRCFNMLRFNRFFDVAIAMVRATKERVVMGRPTSFFVSTRLDNVALD